MTKYGNLIYNKPMLNIYQYQDLFALTEYEADLKSRFISILTDTVNIDRESLVLNGNEIFLYGSASQQ